MTPQSELKLPFNASIKGTNKQIIKSFLMLMLYGVIAVAGVTFIVRIYYTIASFIWNLPIWDLLSL